MNTRIFKDMSKLSDTELCCGLRREPFMWTYLTTLTVIPYTLAYVRRTETPMEEGVFGFHLIPWQLILIGTSVLFFLILSLVGHKKACTEISKRLNDKKNPNQSIEAIVKTPVESGNTQGTQPHAKRWR